MNNIAEQLIKLRKSSGFTQQEVAEKLGISNRTLSKWETGTSLPDAEMIVKLAKLFSVSTDCVLGINSIPDEESSVLREAFKGLNRPQSVAKTIKLERELVGVIFDDFMNHNDDDFDDTEKNPPYIDSCGRNCISAHEFYRFDVANKDSVFAFTMLRNQSNFAWFNDEKQMEKISKLFSFLSEKTALALCRFIHSTDCPESFTADFIASKLDITEEVAKNFLDTSMKFGLCDKYSVELENGYTDVYTSFGEGLLLGIITIAHEYLCGQKQYDYNFNGRCKMIGANK